MRYQGKITDWKDDKGFGFVTPNGGGPRVFVHIKSFSNRQRRPGGNELVTYELTSDARGRPQGVNIGFVGDRPSSPPSTAPGPSIGALVFASVFLAFVAGAVATGKLPFVVLIAYLIGSCVAYLAYVFDKAAALKGQWRTPESHIHRIVRVRAYPPAVLGRGRVLRAAAVHDAEPRRRRNCPGFGRGSKATLAASRNG
ncbi:MAG: DUF1294 domain-containing protein [Betaproteobacteria bacterium]|nr:DUF1294 domain-containing protein [Betaproteobacteria bacterium]